MEIRDYLLITLSLLATALLIYAVRSLRIIGTKISRLQSAIQKSEKAVSDQIQEVVRSTQLLQASSRFPTERDRKKLKYVLSLTSYPVRFSALEELIPYLSNQILAPQEIHLNIAREDMGKMSNGLKDALRRAKVKVFPVSDLGPGKKLIPTLSRTKLPIICIDDDLVLPDDLTFKLMAIHHQYPKDVIASRTHRIAVDPSGKIKKFLEWDLEYSASAIPDARFLATSGAGTLFPYGSLHGDAQDEKLYRELSFHTDDLWWYFQARRNGTNVRRIPGRRALAFIAGSQEVGLWVTGNQERNDQNFSRLVAKYGNPLDKSKLR